MSDRPRQRHRRTASAILLKKSPYQKQKLKLEQSPKVKFASSPLQSFWAIEQQQNSQRI